MLKAIVIGLGLLIFLGVALVAYEVISRAGGNASVSPGAYDAATVALPEGARVIGMTGEGDQLSLLVEDANGGQRVMTIDRRSGALLGVITVESE